MKRREFITLIGSVAAARPLVALAQSASHPVIGFLGTTTRAAWAEPVAAFERRLGELGWIPSRTVTIDYQWTEGHNENVLQIAQGLVARKVDVIVVGGNGVAAVKRTTSTIPIVFPVAIDPVGSGFVTSLSHPAGNVTGLSLEGPDVAGKRLEMLRSTVPDLRRIAIMANVGYPAAKKELDECHAAARTLGLDVTVLALRQPDDIVSALDSLHGNVQAIYVVADAMTNTHHSRISTLALGIRLPTIFGSSEQMNSGGLISYGPSFPDLFRRAAEFVDKILRGTKPSDIPVEQPIKFELVVNMTTAKTLGLTLPPALLALADKVIE